MESKKDGEAMVDKYMNRIVGEGDEPLDQIQFNESNWRTHPEDQMEALSGGYEEVGIVQRVIINLRTSAEWKDLRNSKTVLDGHARCKLAARHGEATIPAIYVDLTPNEERIILASLDTITGMAGTDREMLASLIKSIDTESAQLQALFDNVIATERLDAFYDTGEVEEDEPNLDEADKLLAEWAVEPGQLWELQSQSMPGQVHRILCGDSTDAMNAQRLMGADKARLVWTDPPYGISYLGGKKGNASQESAPHHSTVRNVRPIQNDSLKPEELTALIHSVLVNVDIVTLPGAGIYMASSTGNTLPAIIHSFDDSPFEFHWLLIWLKDQLVLGGGDYHFKHENILYGWKRTGRHYFTSDRTQTSVFEYPRPKVSEMHPTMKPVGLVAHHIKNSTKEGDIVLDPFCGSGTTLAACERMRRPGRGIELEPIYVAVILARMVELGCQAELLK